MLESDHAGTLVFSYLAEPLEKTFGSPAHHNYINGPQFDGGVANFLIDEGKSPHLTAGCFG